MLSTGEHDAFRKLMKRLREEQGRSFRSLAEHTNYDPSHLAGVERGRRSPKLDLAEQVDRALGAGGRLIATLRRRPAQLSAVVSPFVGREEELRLLHEAVDGDRTDGSPRVVVVEGPPGVGKTSLALRVAHDVKERHPDGQVYANLHGYSPARAPAHPADVLEEFLSALGLRDIPPGLDERATTFRSVLDGRRVLIVLDNAARVEQVEPLLPGSASCTVLVTSRRELTGLAVRNGVTRLTVRPMTPVESTTLVRGVIGERAAAEPEAVDVLVERCGRLPLALRIAGEWVARRPGHAVHDLAARLADEQHRLDGLDTGDRSTAMRAVIGWSYRELPEQAARLFRLLGLYRGVHFSVDSAAASAGLPHEVTRRLLEELASVHLVEPCAPGRYRLHDLLRAYAAEQAEVAESEASREAAVRRLVEWYVHTARAAGRMLAPHRAVPFTLPRVSEGVEPARFVSDLTALAWCDTESDNFAPMIRLAYRYRQWTPAWQLAVVLWDWLQVRKPLSVWIETHEAALRAARRALDAEADAWVCTNLAQAFHQQRCFDASRARYEYALEVRRRRDDLHGQAWTLAGLVFLSVDERRMAEALDCAEQSLRIFAEVGDQEGTAEVLLARVDAWRAGAPDRVGEAEEQVREALGLFEALEIHDGQGRAWLKLAALFEERGELVQALQAAGRALDAYRRGGDRRGEADALLRQADLLDAAGQSGRPEREQAWELYDLLSDPRADEIIQRVQSVRPE
ncbi:tetratricopeptide (TPR) repeat protein/transcriptional regulator with XRE-family HTH domain [Saccharothrix tamanrassetensis]|uniref:Tetratricopeptide (TPR) repeat protein/transcriptional regulator with XRE-family HTH domain n=1 Tax=Saccharothrix tamanrassetensis TaxID=1051531 RepID=A0A841CTI2_9PSEU|nr:helix-turn-helix domain-containing protein [Saccharothrix tamanrassetensis]MBB5958736.1 tetratricopeptide (TPR) repeat protein/transcriptional regulator with XRE-family HTH domain [Saccharothrix tamanrassetensis]